MRTIIVDDRNSQVQQDENGAEYHFEKVYIPTGDRKTEYCLTLRRTEHSIKGESHKTYVAVKDPEAKHFIIIQWPGVK